ncbi:MAG: type II toxin-antitoxin system VapC family toxin [Rhodospirillales bacterium]|nr:MAG: type II toxin-antitoxin system VapC family toxin [Rhodospirillales bacterium]
MRFLLDTNIMSDLVRNPHGRITEKILRVGEDRICTSIVVAAELRYGSAKAQSQRLSAQLDAILGAIEILPLEPPVDATYGLLRARLEQAGQPIGGNDLLSAAQAVALGHTIVTDNEREVSRIAELTCENWLRDV